MHPPDRTCAWGGVPRKWQHDCGPPLNDGKHQKAESTPSGRWWSCHYLPTLPHEAPELLLFPWSGTPGHHCPSWEGELMRDPASSFLLHLDGPQVAEGQPDPTSGIFAIPRLARGQLAPQTLPLHPSESRLSTWKPTQCSRLPTSGPLSLHQSLFGWCPPLPTRRHRTLASCPVPGWWPWFQPVVCSHSKLLCW